MLKMKSKTPYWQSFADYQSFPSVKEMFSTVKEIYKRYTLTKTMKAVLNTIKLHAKNFVGVCWLYREEIAKKAKVSVASVDRAVRAFKEDGLITVHNFIHTKRGGKTHNIYVINPLEDPSSDDADDDSFDPSFDASLGSQEDPSIPCAVKDPEPSDLCYKSADKSPDKNLNNLNTSFDKEIDKPVSLKGIPLPFQEIMKPYYEHCPEIIRDRWKTVCVAIKRSCNSFDYTSWDTIGRAWKLVVQRYKRKLIHNSTDDGLGGYFYAVLSDLLLEDYFQSFRQNGYA